MGKALAEQDKRSHMSICAYMPLSKSLQCQLFPFFFPKKDVDTQNHPLAKQQQKRRRMQQVCIMQISSSRNNDKNRVINSRVLITGSRMEYFSYQSKF